jgi:MATE family multidrug resistance protein
MHGITAFFPTRTAWVRESTGYFQLAWPLVVASMLNMSISITDVVMMGWIGPTALAGGVAASDFYSIVYYLAAGIVAGITPLMAQARGARRYGELRRVLQTGFWVVAGLSVPAVFLCKATCFSAGWAWTTESSSVAMVTPVTWPQHWSPC